MKKKLLLLFTILAIGLTNVWAYNFSAVAPSGQTLYYNTTGGNAMVTCQNAIASSSSQAYSNLTGALVIPASVTYYGTTYSVTSIGNDAFYGCSGLTSVTIPSSVTSIGEYAFAGCSGLTSVTIPNSVTSIGEAAFYRCASLTSATIGTGVNSIGGGAFSNCTNLTSLYFNATNCTTMGLTNDPVFASYDGYYADYIDNTTLTTVVFGDNVTNIPAYAFRNCTVLNNVTIPNSVTSIGDFAFYGCSSLASVNIPNSVTTIGVCTFSGCSGLTSVTIPNSVTTIGVGTFSGCSGLTSVTIPNSVTSIEHGTFRACSGLTSVTIPNSVTTIGDGTFDGCSGLTSVTIPNSVTSIGAEAFWGCSGLISVTIPNSMTSIEGRVFSHCSGLTNVTIPNSVTSIGYEAFSECSSLMSVTIPNSVTSIGSEAFYRCTGLTEITSEAITAPLLGEYAFNGVNPMIPVNIPCGRMLSYMSRWSYFSNFVEGAGYSFEATSDNPAMGYVTVLTQPTCSAPQAVVNAVAIPGYRFDHWSNGSTANPYSFTLSQNTSLVAYFDVAARDTVFVHDTTFVNVFVPVHDTTFIDNYIHDTTIVNNYIHDTTTVTQWQYDTTYVNVYVPVHDTTIIDNYIHDTTIVNNYIHDTSYVDVYIHDTTFVELLVHDTLTITEELNWYVLNVVSGDAARGLVAGNGRFPENTEVEIAAIPVEGSRFVQWQDGNTDNPRTVTMAGDMNFVATFDVSNESVTDVDMIQHSVTTRLGQIVVENAGDAQIRIFDNLGRCLSTTKSMEQVRVFNMPASGAYMVQVGNYPAQKVVVIK